MKKIFLILGIVWTMFLLGAQSNVFAAYGDPAPRYWNGNRNYVLLWQKMGGAFYIDKSSLYCEEYNPPHYILAVSVLKAWDRGENGHWEYDGTYTHRFYYNFNDRRMCIYVDNENRWRFMPPNGSNAESGLSMYVGEAAFYLGYKIPFYGSQGSSGFNSAFYSRLD